MSVCTRGSSGTGTVARHQSRRTNSPVGHVIGDSDVEFVQRHRRCRTGRTGVRQRAPDGPASSSADHVRDRWRRPRTTPSPWSAAGRSAGSRRGERPRVRPSKTRATVYSTDSGASPPRRNCRCILVGTRPASTVCHAAARLCAVNWPPNARLPAGPLPRPIQVSAAPPGCTSSRSSRTLIPAACRRNRLPRFPIR